MSTKLLALFLTDSILALLLLVLFVYLSRISQGIPGIASWGVGHFLYTLGATFINALSIYDHSINIDAFTPALIFIGGFLSSIGLMLLSCSVLSFSFKRTLIRSHNCILFAVLFHGMLILIFGNNLNTSGLAMGVFEVIFLLLLLYSFSQLDRGPAKLPARLMMLSSLPLLYKYIVDVINSFDNGYSSAIEWANVDLATWFLLNFCMLMIASFKAAEGYRQAALHDPLTGVLNRRGLREKVDNHPNRNQATSIISFDIDYFKQINDTYSHTAGDKLLQAITAKVQSCLTTDQLFARTGGEEFLIVTFGSRALNAPILAEFLRIEIAELFITHENQRIAITASLGVAISPSRYKFSHLVHQADLQLYKAKENGRNQVQHCYLDLTPISVEEDQPSRVYR